MQTKPLHPVAVLRQQYGLSQVGLAAALDDYAGYSNRTIQKWEQGSAVCSDKKLKFIEKILKEINNV